MDIQYKAHWNAGLGINNKAGAMDFWGMLWLIKFLNIPEIHIYGDPKIILDHVKGKTLIKQPKLHGWLRRIQGLWTQLGQP